MKKNHLPLSVIIIESMVMKFLEHVRDKKNEDIVLTNSTDILITVLASVTTTLLAQFCEWTCDSDFEQNKAFEEILQIINQKCSYSYKLNKNSNHNQGVH